MIIAYNHTINFISKAENKKNISDSSLPIITVKEDKLFHLHVQLPFRKRYSNNQGRDITLSSDKVFDRTQKGKCWCYEVENVMSFFWESGTKTLVYLPHEKFTTSLLEYWTLHIVLPIFFTIEETYNFLHAGAVEIDGKPVLFIADSFGGKSTMTDFFMKQGHSMISDDKVASYESNGAFYAVPSYSYHRPYRKLEDLGFSVSNMAKSSKPIHAIYELEQVNQDNPIIINELHGLKKFKALRYSNEFNLSFLKVQQLNFLSNLAKVVPVYNITVPWSLERLDEVYKIIYEHSKDLNKW